MGYGQFMPSSFRNYAVDFNGNSHTKPVGSGGCHRAWPTYFKAHGWKGQPGGGTRPGTAAGP